MDGPAGRGEGFEAAPGLRFGAAAPAAWRLDTGADRIEGVIGPSALVPPPALVGRT